MSMRVAIGQLRGVPGGRRIRLFSAMIVLSLLLSTVAAGLFPATPVGAQEAGPYITASVVPADVLAYTVVPLDPTSDQWTQGLALLERAGLGQEVGEFRDMLAGDSADEIPLDMLLGGEAAFVITDTSIELFVEESIAASEGEAQGFSGIDETGLAAVLATSSPDIIEAGVRLAIGETAQSEDVEVQEVDYEGFTISYVEVPAGSTETPLAMARVDDLVLVAGFPADLESLIDTYLGYIDPLSELDSFSRVREALDGDHLALGYFNPFPSDNLRNSFEQMGLPPDLIQEQAAAGGFQVAADDLGLRIETVSLDAGTDGTEATFPDSRVLAQAPDSAMVFFAASDLAGTQVLDVLGSVLFSTAGLVGSPTPGAQSLDERLDAQYESLARQIGVNPRTELFQRLTGEYGFWLEREETGGALNALFASGLDEPQTVSNAISQFNLLIQMSVGGGVESRPIGETRVYSIETGDPVVSRVEYGVVGDQLVIGLGDAVDNVDTEPVAPLADDERYDAIMSALPVPEDGIFYVDLEQAIPLLSDAASTDVGSVAENLETAAEAAADDQPDTEPAPGGDAADDCAAFASQAEAQAAYDAFEPGSYSLDQDFDGEACEDYFNRVAGSDATPTAEATAEPVATANPITVATISTDAVTAFGLVAYDDDEGNSRTTSLILIEDPAD